MIDSLAAGDAGEARRTAKMSLSSDNQSFSFQNDREFILNDSGRVAAGGARARVLAEEDDEEGARGERRCGRAARNHMLSAHLRIADDVY